MKGLTTDGNNINCYTCQFWRYCNVASAHGYKVGACTQYTANKPRGTNADRIRRMTDDELSMFLDDVQKYNVVCKPIIADDCADCMTDLCWQCWRDWLQREAGE